MIVDFDKEPLIPGHLNGLLAPVLSLLKGARSVESISDERPARLLMEALTAELEETGFVGIHHTRALPESIKSNGLQLLTGRERRAKFLREYGKLFTAGEIADIEAAWKNYFCGMQYMGREGQVWFNYTSDEFDTAEESHFLRYFGGEQIHMPLHDHPSVSEKLRSIGVPLRVRCRLFPSVVTEFRDHSAAWVWLSIYHKKLNPSAAVDSFNIYSPRSIPASAILSVDPL